MKKQTKKKWENEITNVRLTTVDAPLRTEAASGTWGMASCVSHCSWAGLELKVS
jgi:hypothetical protein